MLAFVPTFLALQIGLFQPAYYITADFKSVSQAPEPFSVSVHLFDPDVSALSATNGHCIDLVIARSWQSNNLREFIGVDILRNKGRLVGGEEVTWMYSSTGSTVTISPSPSRSPSVSPNKESPPRPGGNEQIIGYNDNTIIALDRPVEDLKALAISQTADGKSTIVTAFDPLDPSKEEIRLFEIDGIYDGIDAIPDLHGSVTQIALYKSADEVGGLIEAQLVWRRPFSDDPLAKCD